MNESQHAKAVESVAIIGLAGRFPGAKNVEKFWGNIKAGVESIKFFSDYELMSAGVNPNLLQNPNYIKAKPLLEGIELFDAAFFGINPREAEIIDPQHRVFLECAWEALENAGYTPNNNSDRIGVYASTSRSSYLINNLMTNPELAKSVGFLQLLLSNDRDYLPTRVSYKMNLTGPSININTACSSSLVAVCFACQSLLNYQTDIALAGGVTIMIPQNCGYLYQKGVITSPDGHCRSFDAKANGTIFGSGLGIVVLKRLKEALNDRDHIYAIIKSSAINNDGAVKMGFTAPSINGQAEVIAEAIALAGIDARTISYVETHGTGTSLGDPAEIAALTKAFRMYTDANGFCAVGSVKTNVGHLNSAAGITGLIKAVLALKNRFIPPSLHFRQPNPEIDFNKSPFYVNTRLKKWKRDPTPRRAGVSSFGVGGTNAHVILEEAPRVDSSKDSKPPYLFVLSTKTKASLEIAAKNLAQHLKLHPHLKLSDVAFTLQLGRNSFNHRRMVVCHSRENAIKILERADNKGAYTNTLDSRDHSVIFMFPGQGSQYVNMGKGLYRMMPAFRSTVDQCADLLLKEWGIDLRSILFAERNSAKYASEAVRQTLNAQLSLFVIEYALADMLMRLAIRPQAMIGHSIGEYVAACLAGVFTLNDALSLIVSRGKLMEALPGGAMLAVSQSERNIRENLEGNLSLAALNSPNLCVVSGPFEAIDRYEEKLNNMNIAHRRLHTSHAFHSKMMEPILPEFTEQVKRVNLNSPQIPYISNVTGTWIRTKEATDANYWARHLRSTVRLLDGFGRLLEGENRIAIEVGPGQTLTMLARLHNEKKRNHVFLNTLPHPSDKRSDEEITLKLLGYIWCLGIDLNWQNLYTNLDCHRVPLPTYPFERKPFWVEPKTAHIVDSNIPKQPDKKRQIAEWFYRPVWRKSNLKDVSTPLDLNLKYKNWLVFIDQCKFGQQLVKALKDANQEVTVVRIGDHFAQLTESTFCLNPSVYDHYTVLLENLMEKGKIPQIICHLWGITANKYSTPSIEFIDQIQRQAFNSLLNIVQVFSKQDGNDPLRIEVVTNNMQKVTGNDLICPEKAIMMGPCRVIPKEYPRISCRSIDIVLSEYESNQMQLSLDLLIQELLISPNESIIAFRGKNRWIQTFERVTLNGHECEATRFRKGGVYLITGGLGGVGLQLAEHLSSTFHAKLALIQRSVFPPANEWDQWLKTHDKHDNISRKIRKIRKIQELGGKILVLCADVTDIEKMREAIHQTENVFGRIDGVIHCAGMPDGALINRRKTEMTDIVMAPKVKGTLIIDEIFREKKLDFFILFSSLSSYLAPVGQVGYTAANAFLDAFAYYKVDQKNPYTISISWDAWKGIGMAANRPKLYTSPASDSTLEPVKTAHPLLGRIIADNSNEKIYESLLNVDKHWLLNEHRVLNRATLPGTAYLEMVREAFAQNTDHESIAIQEAYFLNPLSLADDEKRIVRTTLTQHGDHHNFSIKSNTSSQKDTWKEHAKGRISFLESEPVHTMNIRKIKEKINVKHPFKAKDTISLGKYLKYGYRWRNINWIELGENEGFAELELPETCAQDLKHYKLHPALFDIATGFMGFGMSDGSLYLPFYYKNIFIRGPLPQKIFSYVRNTSKIPSGKETLSFSISVMDEHGKQLVEVEQYTLRKVNSKAYSEFKSIVKTERKVENIRLEIEAPGILDSLEFHSSTRIKPLSSEVEVEVSATGLNFKDVLMALGMIPLPQKSPQGLGMEFAGRIVRIGAKVDSFNLGDKVIGFANSSFSHYLTTSAALVALKPSSLSMEEGATIPVAYLTAYYALAILGRLRKGERVLIHSAAGGVGMAALKIAQLKEAEIFATAGTQQKRDFLSSIGIKNVYNSRSLDFADEILADTGNKGVNVVLNSLSGKFIPKSLSILAQFGRFLEIGMRDILLNHRLDLGFFAKNITFHAIMMGPHIPNFASLWHDLVQLFENNILDLMPFKRFPLSQTTHAFKYMTKGEHIGKIILSHPKGDTLADLIIKEDKIKKQSIDKSHIEYTSNTKPYPYLEQNIKKFSKDDLLKQHFPKEFFEVGVLPSEGAEILKRSITCSLPHILISTHDLQKRIGDSKTITIDRIAQALEKIPKPEKRHQRPLIDTEYVAPRNVTEEKVTEIWQELLGIDKVGIYDNFFELGGHSLLAAQIYAQLREDFGIEFPIESIFEEPNIAALAEMIKSILKIETHDH
jgi:acyl transferase domain-containing protein/acyl carrier protein